MHNLIGGRSIRAYHDYIMNGKEHETGNSLREHESI